MITIYPGCCLSGLPKRQAVPFHRQFNELKEALRKKGFKVLDFLGTKKGDCNDVYECDIIKGVGEADLFLGVLNHRSIGLGIEIGAALWRYKIPVLLIAHRQSTVTRLAQGIHDAPDCTFERYQNMVIDGVRLVKEKIDNTDELIQLYRRNLVKSAIRRLRA
jgi:hypothetical protein